jgi:hypothetical protein
VGLIALIGVAAYLALGRSRGCGPPLPVDIAARWAGEEHGVPAGLLLAMAYAESRLTLDGPAGDQRGWLRLHAWRPGRSPLRAAALLGGAPADYQLDPVHGMRGAAALVRDAQRASGSGPSPDPAAWRQALERFNGGVIPLANRLYADQVIALARGGFEATSDRGYRVVVAGAGGGPTGAPGAAALFGPRPPDVVGAPFAPWLSASARSRRALPAAPRPIRFIIIHTTENTFSTILDFFARPTTGVASHYLIRSRDGLTVQMTDERAVAFHDACFNEESIGVEHEGYVAAGEAWYGDAMYEASARLVRDIARRHRIPLDRRHIFGHGEAPDCSDHTDPGPAWDWDRYMRLLRR